MRLFGMNYNNINGQLHLDKLSVLNYSTKIINLNK